MKQQSNVLCVGRLYCDLVFSDMPRLPSFGTEVYANSLMLDAGGGAYITAATLAALGRKVYLAATVPAAPFDQIVLSQTKAHGVDVSLCSAAAASSDPQITVAMTGAEDRAFLTRADGPAIPSLHAEQLRGLNISHLHIGEMATLTDASWLIDLARELGWTISLDCAWYDDVPEGIETLIGQVDVFLPNEGEAEKFSTRPAPLTVIKQGEKGATALDDTGKTSVPVTPVEVIDPTGAGDAFNAGFLHRWLAASLLEDALACGNECGAATVAAKGGSGGLQTIAQQQTKISGHQASMG